MNKLVNGFRYLVLIAALLASEAVFAQTGTTPTLSAEQQRVLRNLPQDQRENLARQYLGLSPATGTVPASSGVESTIAPPVFPEQAPEQDGVPVLAARDTVVLIVQLEREDPGSRELIELKQRIDERNPYALDEFGNIALPGLSPIALAGLSEDQARIRIEAEPVLSGLAFEIHLLPVENLQDPQLKPFGYDMFSGQDRRFSVGSQLPVPRGYSVGPGDWVNVALFGNKSAQYTLQIDRNGALTVPELGPVQVGGMTVESMRSELMSLVERQMIGTTVSITLGELRAIRVFLVGDVNHPGAYAVSPFATVTNVLAHGGGIATHGSLRSVQLKRNGKLLTTLDLYQLMLKGDASRDRRVVDGDVIFVPPVGSRVSIAGQVLRPAIYETKGSTSVQDIIDMAGGTLPTALRKSIRVQRRSPSAGLNILNLDIDSPVDRSVQIEAGDLVLIPGDSQQLDNAVALTGHVYQPGLQEWKPGLRLSDVLTNSRDLKPKADSQYVLIKRRDVPNGQLTVFSANLHAIWSSVPGVVDPELKPRDEIVVFSLIEGRDVYLQPVLDTLELQSRLSSPTPTVRVNGEVKLPGRYPLEPGMTIGDLVRAGGGLSQAAYLADAELTRFTIDQFGTRQSHIESVSLDALDPNGLPGGALLQPFDSLNVKRTPEWDSEKYVEILGEVAFPGKYSIAKNESLSSLVARAGGLTEGSFPEGSVFTRKLLRQREKEQLERLAARLESDMAALAISESSQPDSISAGRSLLSQLRSARPTGRLVIDLNALLRENKSMDVLLRDGDKLFIPRKTQEVTVIGEVQYPTSHLWQKSLSREDYLARSGGLTSKSDRRRIYIVRASGEVVASNRSRFFSGPTNSELKPGDTIVVPIQTDRIAPLVLWSSATQIVYNLAIAAAAANGF